MEHIKMIITIANSDPEDPFSIFRLTRLRLQIIKHLTVLTQRINKLSPDRYRSDMSGSAIT